MKLKLIIPNETSQTKESIYCRILLTWNSRKFKLIYHDRKQIGRYLGVGRWGGVGGRSKKSAEETFESNKYFSLSWLCWVVLWVLYMCMSKLIKLHILNMCSLFYFEFLTVIEWMKLLFSTQEGKHPLISMLESSQGSMAASGITAFWSSTLRKNCFVFIMHNKEEIWDRNSSTSVWMALKTHFHRAAHVAGSLNSPGQCLAYSWHSIVMDGSCCCYRN